MDLDTARALFARAPFIADLGIEPVAVGEGRMLRAAATMALTRSS